MIRTIVDEQGRRWDVTVGRESYGMQVFLYFPQGAEGVRKSMMSASTRLDAQQELEAMSEAELLAGLRASVPWESEGYFPG